METANYTKEPLKKEKGSVYEISLEQAASYTKAWADNKGAAFGNDASVHAGHFIKAFLIDAQELRDILDNTYAGEKPSYIRVYFGLDEQQEPYRREKLVAVPVDEYGIDMIKPKDAAKDADPLNSNIYDFTLPCPPTCDINSGLYFGRTKKNNSDH
jgi:hypothetical protein